jgi:hypothetical protein
VVNRKTLQIKYEFILSIGSKMSKKAFGVVAILVICVICTIAIVIHFTSTSGCSKIKPGGILGILSKVDEIASLLRLGT